MSTVPAGGADNTDGEADRQVDATVQLRKEVADYRLPVDAVMD